MKRVLIASFDMEVGGVERSLISMLENFNYDDYKVDLMLYSHTGNFMKFLPKGFNLLEENECYTSFRKSIKQILKDKNYAIAVTRILASLNSNILYKAKGLKENCYYQMQLMWKYAIPFLPKLNGQYDIAISYLWPHDFIANKVKAKTKIAWIHTDYSKLETDVNLDLKIWNKYKYIIAVSEDCKKSFLNKYPSLKNKIKVIENITSPDFIKEMSKETIEEKGVFCKENFNIVSVARFSHAKGIDNAVKALKILHQWGFKNIKWYVVGYGGDETMIKELIKENQLEDSFILLGKKINPYPYMKACDLYVQPSRYEGKAVTVTEAKILGKPVMITNYSTAKSQVEHGEDGYICELSVEGIAKGIKTMYKYPELANLIDENCKNTDYSNKEELEKLYDLF